MSYPHMIVFCYDDWHALYVDGKRVEQSHGIRVYDLVHAAAGRPFTLEERSADEDWWNAAVKSGAEVCPENFNDIPEEAFA